MDDILTMLGTYLVFILAAITIENSVFARAMGLSRIITLVDNMTSTVVFCSLLTVTTILSGTAYYFLYNTYIKEMTGAAVYRVPAVVLCMSLSFMIVFVGAVKLIPYEYIGKAAEAMPTATFNCMVFGTVLLAGVEQLTLFKTVLFSFGSAIGYTLAILLVAEGQRKLQSRDIPAAFKGLPATLLYLAGLAMAIFCLTGRSFSI